MGQFGLNISQYEAGINLYTESVLVDNKEVINNVVNCREGVVRRWIGPIVSTML